MSASLVQSFVAATAKVTGLRAVPLHEPHFGGNEWTYLKECLDSTFVSSVGPFVDRFERDLAAYTGAAYAVAVVNGTAALQVALQLAGVEARDEVIVPTLSFVATANAVAYCGATPHFADSDERTLGLDPVALSEHLNDVSEMREDQCTNRQTGRPIRAVLPMHTFGHPVDIEALTEVCRRHNLRIVEDAAESLGSTFNGHHTGTFGLLGAFSFNGNKTATTGGGGAIITNDAALARRAKYLTTTARSPHKWAYHHTEIGYNYRMPNLNAALGCAQLEQLPRFIEAKRELFRRYTQAFEDVEGVSIFSEPANCHSNYWLQTAILDESVASQRDAVLDATNDAGLMTRPAWILLHSLPPYENCPRASLPVAEMLERRMISLPSSVNLLTDR